MLSGWLPQLDIPPNARLVGVETTFGEDGSQSWTITFKALPATPHAPPAALARPHGQQANAPRRASREAAEPSRVPERPPPLTEQQLGGAGLPPSMDTGNAGAGEEMPNEVDSPLPLASPTAPTPAAFPLLPYQQGATNRLFPLRASVKTYAWGRPGRTSLVGMLAAANDPEFSVEERTPYAELWMGTHPSGPSMVLLEMPWRTITPLYEWLKLNPSMHGRRNALDLGHVGGLQRRQSMLNLAKHGLPFLFKVLSVQTALSIQAHPDKVLAAQLHASRPDMYKDDNHKPEMTLAVSNFEALCQFQKANHVVENLRACPELVVVVGEEAVARLAAAADAAAPLTPALPPGTEPQYFATVSGLDAAGSGTSPLPSPAGGSESPLPFADSSSQMERLQMVKPALQNLFSRLMRAESVIVKQQLDALMRRISLTNPMLRAPVDELAVRLHEQYPADVGVFCVYLLNYLVLKPGEALFLGANEPHAYISGECVECMAASDNVVRAGLTPKWKDVDNLVSMLTYVDGPPHIIGGHELSPYVWRYVTPVEEFLVDRVEVPAKALATLRSAPGVSIILVLSGSGTIEEFPEDGIGAAGLLHSVEAGAIFVASSDTFLRICGGHNEKMLLFRAAEKH